MCIETLLGGIEFGGTKIVLATGTPDGKIYEREVFPTTAPESVLPKIVDWFKARSIQALGVGAFGPTGVNPDLPSYGKILSTPKQAALTSVSYPTGTFNPSFNACNRLKLRQPCLGVERIFP